MKKHKESVDDKSKQKKKKKKGCSPCGCVAVFALVFVLILGVGLGVGGYFADKYMTDTFGVNISDAFELVGEVFTVNESKIITNAPEEGDKQGFYDAVGDTLFLRDGTIDDETFSALLGSFMGGDESGAEEGTSTIRRTDGEDGLDEGGAEEENPEDTAQTLANILNKENIDIEKLNAINDADFTDFYTEKFVLNVKDKQLMAFVVSLWNESNAESQDAIVKSITPAQLILSQKNDDPVIFLTVKIELAPILDAYLTTDTDLPDFVISTIKSLLPKEIFVSVELTLGESATTGDILINGMSKKSQENMHALWSGILKLTGASYDSKTVINDLIAQTVSPILETADEMLDFRQNVTDGYIGFDIYGTLASTVFDGLEGNDLALLYTRVMQADVEEMKTANQDKFFKQPVDAGDGTIIMSAEQSQQVFLDEFSAKYLMHTNFWWDESDTSEHKKIYLDPTDEEKERLTEVNLGFNDISALFGLGESEIDLALGLEIKSLLDTHGLNRAIGGEETEDRSKWYVNRPQREIEFYLTDAMLGALIDSQLGKMFESNEFLSDVELLFVHTTEGEEETINAEYTTDEDDSGEVSVKRNFVTMGITIKTEHLFENASFVTGLIDEEIGVIITLEVTPALVETALSQPEICYCNFTVERTRSLLQVLEKIGVDFFSAEQISEQFATPVRDAIKKMEQMLGKTEINSGKIHLPDVFTLIATNGFPYNADYTDENGDPIELSGADIHLVLHELYNNPDIEIENAGTAEETHYLVDQTSKSWMDADAGITIIPGDAKTFYYGRTNNRAKAKSASDKLGDFGSVLGSADFEKLGSVVGYYNDTDPSGKMYITIEYDIASYLDDGKTDMSLLPLDTVYATFEIDKSITSEYLSVPSYSTKMVINHMAEQELKILHDMMCYVNQANKTRFTNLEKAIGAFAYAENSGILDL